MRVDLKYILQAGPSSKKIVYFRQTLAISIFDFHASQLSPPHLTLHKSLPQQFAAGEKK